MARGFTLLELLVVLAIASAVAAIALPQLGAMRASFTLRADARQLASALRLARSEAIARQREVSLVIDLDERAFRAEGLAGAHRLAPDIDVTVLAARANSAPDAHAGAIRFFADGSSSGGRVVLAATGRRYVVDVDWLTGRVVIQ